MVQLIYRCHSEARIARCRKNADLHSFAGTVFKLRIDTEIKDEGTAC